MKKLFIAAPMMICILLSLLVPIRASASFFSGYDEPNYDYVNHGEHFSLQEFQTETDCDLSHYFFIQWDESKIVSSDGTTGLPYYGTYYIDFLVCFDDSVNFVVEGDIYTIKFDYKKCYQGYHSSSYGSDGKESTGKQTPRVSTSSNIEFAYIKINSNTNIVEFYRSNDKLLFATTSEGFINISTNIFDYNSLNLKVTFSPSLHGEVNRGYTDSDGVKYNGSNFIMTVSNAGKKNAAYRMTIYEGDSIVYQYLKYEWTWATDITDVDLDNLVTNRQRQLLGSDWHIVKPIVPDVQVFSWNQLNIKPNTNYNVVVEAVEYDKSIIIFNQGYFDSPQIVYSSTFYVKDLSDVVYDHNNSSGGIIPYSSDDDYYRARITRQATMDNDGNIDYTNYSAYDDPNSWYNTGSLEAQREKIKQIHDDVDAGKRRFSDNSSSWFDDSSLGDSSGGNNYFKSSYNGASSSGTFNGLLSETNSVFAFFSTVLGYFPPTFLLVFNLGFWTIFILAVVGRLK